jgi:hypothetical protein
MDDYYLIFDMLNRKNLNKLDFYIETPGGSGEAAEEIVGFLRNKFQNVSFIVSGEAKSAGTLIVLSGDEIFMTDSGSLGPIDAQVKIGRGVISAYDYIEWVKEKREEAEKIGKLNPFDATMVAQISPGEISGVYHSLHFAKDLVVEWLTKYKFKNWNITETKKVKVNEKKKREQAREIAEQLTDHSKWRSHGRSIKISDLRDIGLKINRIEDDPSLAEIVYRIQTIIRLLYVSTSAYKIFATSEEKILKEAIPINKSLKIPKGEPVVVEIEPKCPKCGKIYNLYAKFVSDPKIDEDFRKKKRVAFPKDSKLKCKCGFEIDLSGIRNEIEIKTGKKIIT